MAFASYVPSKSKSSKDCDLCKQLVKKLGEDNLSEPLRDELIKVNGELMEATVQYFRHRLVVDCVMKFLDKKINEKIENKGKGVLSDPIYLTLVKKYSSANGIQAFGVTADLIDKTISRKQKTQAEKEELNKFVEAEINNFCVKITEYAGYAHRYKNNPRRAFQEAVKDLSSQYDGLAVARCKLESDEKELNCLISSYFENLLQGVSMLKSLLSLHEEALNFQSSLGNLYGSRQSTLASKINRFEHQVLVATYHKQSVKALTAIREELDEKKKIIDEDLNTTNSELQTYLVLGPTYEQLVNEYFELLRKIQHQKWTIESLKRRQSFGGSLSDEEQPVNSFEQEEEEEEEGSSTLAETSGSSTVIDIGYNSRLADSVDNLRLDETADKSILDEIVDNLENFTKVNSFEEENGCSTQIETSGSSTVVEIANNSRLEDSVFDFRVDETSDDSILDEVVDNFENFTREKNL